MQPMWLHTAETEWTCPFSSLKAASLSLSIFMIAAYPGASSSKEVGLRDRYPLTRWVATALFPLMNALAPAPVFPLEASNRLVRQLAFLVTSPVNILVAWVHLLLPQT